MRASDRESSLKPADPDLELRKFEDMITELKVRYEQYFMGTVVHPPDKLHFDTVRCMRTLRTIPFMKPAHRYLLRSLENRYKSYNDYWRRVLREKEEGTYHKDLFKANMRARVAAEDVKMLAQRTGAPKALVDLFTSYKDALGQLGKDAKDLNFDKFHATLVAQAKAVKEAHGVKKVTFAVVVRNNKVTLQVKPKSEE